MTDANNAPIDWDRELKAMEEGTKPVPPGLYAVRVTGAEVKQARTGSPMITITVMIDDGGPYQGRLLFSNLVFKFDNPQAVRRTVSQVQLLGVSPEELRSNRPSLAQLAAKVIGARAMGEVTHREWKGETQMDIRFVSGNVPTAGTPNVPSMQSPSTPSPAPSPSVPSPPTPSPIQGVVSPPPPPPEEAPPTPTIEPSDAPSDPF